MLFVVFFLLPRVQRDMNCCGSVLAPHSSIRDPPSSAASPSFLPWLHVSAASILMFLMQSSLSLLQGAQQLQTASPSCCVHTTLPGDIQLLDTPAVMGCQERDDDPPVVLLSHFLPEALSCIRGFAAFKHRAEELDPVNSHVELLHSCWRLFLG